jgi:hypothetical protein
VAILIQLVCNAGLLLDCAIVLGADAFVLAESCLRVRVGWFEFASACLDGSAVVHRRWSADVCLVRVL